MDVVSKLKSRLFFPSGKPRKGAMSRASEYLDVSRQTIKNWCDGVWTPGEATLSRIAVMLASPNVELTARKSGPKTDYFPE